MKSQDFGIYAVADSFCSSCLPDGFDALMSFNNESDDVDMLDAPVYSLPDELNTSSHDPTLSLAPDSDSEHNLLPSENQAQGQQSDLKHSELSVKEKCYELDDFYYTPGLEWDPDCLVVPPDEADNGPTRGLAACETGPQCFNCGSPVGWDEAAGRLEDCETCFCPN